MLRIKEDKIDKLKDFRFKPKYDEDTGKIYKYVHRFEINKDASKIDLEIKKDIYLRGQYDYIEYWKIDLEEFEGIEILYDLIKADMVEKI